MNHQFVLFFTMKSVRIAFWEKGIYFLDLQLVMNNKKLKIGITGGIGTGKSLVSNLYRDKGYKVIEADDVAKEILSNDTNIRKQIIKEFGSASFKNGKPNTKYLADKVFSNPEKVKKISLILHPPTLRKIEALMGAELKKNNIVFVEAALIFEAHMESMFDYILLLVSEDRLRIERIKKRNKISEDEILQRMENQLPDKIKKLKSDFILENNSSIEELVEKAEFFLHIFEKICV